MECFKRERERRTDHSGVLCGTTTVTHVGLVICPKTLGGLVKKTEQLRLFTPEQNIDADAWKINYRVYYDFFIRKSYEDTIYAYTYTETVS